MIAEQTEATKSTRKRVGKPKSKKAAATKKPVKVAQGRESSKTATVLALLRRKDGATTAELLKATGWQPHSLRGFLSGAVKKKMGLDVASTKREDGERSYSISA